MASETDSGRDVNAEYLRRKEAWKRSRRWLSLTGFLKIIVGAGTVVAIATCVWILLTGGTLGELPYWIAAVYAGALVGGFAGFVAVGVLFAAVATRRMRPEAVHSNFLPALCFTGGVLGVLAGCALGLVICQDAYGARLTNLRLMASLAEDQRPALLVLNRGKLSMRVVDGRVVELELTERKLGKADFDEIAKLVDLESLNFDKSPLRAEWLRTLARLPKLKKLTLSETRQTDKNLALVAEIRSLEVLDLSGNVLSDAGLTPLTSLPNVRELRFASWLPSSNLTAAGLRKLAAIPSIRRIEATQFDVTDAQLSSLQRKFPHVNFVVYRVASPWR